MQQTISRIGTAGLSVLLVAGGAFVPATHAAPVVVQYWENLCWSPAREDLQYMVTAFNNSHPGIQLQPVCFSNANVLQPRLLAAIQQHRPPALSQTDAFAVATYVDEGAVQDLTPYIQGKNGLTSAQIADYFTPQWQNGRYKGGMYSLPFNDTSVTVLWYNPTILKSAGITTIPTTWTQFAADCAKVTTGGNWCMDTTDNEETLWEPMVRQWGGQLVNAAGTRAAFDSAAGIGALQFFVNLVKKGYVHHTNSATSQWQQDFTSGHVAFEVYSSEGAASTQAAIGNKFTMGAAPMPAGPVSNVDGNAGDNIFMFKDAPAAVKDAAWAYMKWATQPKWTAWWSEHLDAAPVRKSAVAQMSGFLKAHPLLAVPITELGRAYYSPTVSGWAQAQSDIDTQMSKAMLGQETSTQAMATAAAQVNHDIATAG
jgi:ABC-type glycerol-3-phosphate transport system substrate-binding protein